MISTHPSLALGESPRAPMPVNLPPVGPARARRLRLLALRENALRDVPVDVDEVAAAIVRRGEFARRLAVRLAAEARAGDPPREPRHRAV